MGKFMVGVITASDKGSKGERQDISGQVIREMIADIDGEVVRYEIVPDDPAVIKETLIHFADNDKLDLILTTGGTGLGPRDNTPEATLEVVDKLVPGIPEAMRLESLKKTNRAMLSRAVAGVRHRTLIINLPGSPKAVKECLEVVLPVLTHGLEILRGDAGECAAKI
ncbi:MAG TPA: MogA/MoaB family molybdenum cofactor biosynthesis protein [Bacillota bacterium]|nr:MogA/MoaB family molybdenum cofactor biosynthesis protein [Bacillota bacterium]